MTRLMLVVFVLIAMTSSALAGGTLIQRVDSVRGCVPSWTTGWCDASGWEAWDFSYPGFPDYEVGRLFPVKAGKDTLLLGGYVAWFQEPRQWFMEPFVVFEAPLGSDWKLEYGGGLYAPLNGGPWCYYTAEASMTRPVGKLRLGAAYADCWSEGTGDEARLGLKASFDLGRATTLSARWLWGLGDAKDALRLQVTIGF